MGNFINSTTLIPLIPLVTSIFIFILWVSFNRTINRLTKPVTALVSLSLLSSAFISSFDYFKKIEEELVLSEFIKFFEENMESNNSYQYWWDFVQDYSGWSARMKSKAWLRFGYTGIGRLAKIKRLEDNLNAANV